MWEQGQTGSYPPVWQKFCELHLLNPTSTDVQTGSLESVGAPMTHSTDSRLLQKGFKTTEYKQWNISRIKKKKKKVLCTNSTPFLKKKN